MSSHLPAQRSPTFEQKLQGKVSVTWQDQQLAVALERLASAGEITLWLDRRVDRQQTVTMQCVDLPLVQAFERLAQQQSLGFTRLEKIVYLGPQQTALELTTLIDQARDTLATPFLATPSLGKTPTTIRKRWLRPEATTWPRLSEPQALVESWLRNAKIQCVGSEQIPHDLWPEQTLPPLALVDRLVLVLVGFDLTCEIAANGKTCEVVPITRPLKLARQRPFPKRPPRNSPHSESHQRFTLRLENQPLGQVLDHFAKQLQLEVVWSVKRKEQVCKQLVSCDVKNADLDELLQSVLKPAELLHQREGKRVTIQAR